MRFNQQINGTQFEKVNSSLSLKISIVLGSFLTMGSIARASERTVPHCAQGSSYDDTVVLVPGGGHGQGSTDHYPTYPHGEEESQAMPHEEEEYPTYPHGQGQVPTYPHGQVSNDDYDSDDSWGHESVDLYKPSYQRTTPSYSPALVLDPIGGGYPSGLEDGKTYMLVASHSKKCLDVSNHSSAPKAYLQQWACHGEGNQQFKAKKMKKGGYELVAMESQLCLKANKSGLCDGDSVIQAESCKGKASQFDVKPSKKSPFAFNLSFQHSKKCLDVKDGSLADGGRVQQWACHGGENQDWYLLPAIHE